MRLSFACLLVALFISTVSALRSASVSSRPSTKLYESFGIKLPTVLDAISATPKELLGEVNYKEKFVASYKPDALLLGEDLVTKIRKNRLLELTAQSGLLEALEEKGLTLSKIEKLLPIIDELELLPLAEKNTGLILSVTPLLVDTAFLAVPLAVSLIKTGSGTFNAIAAVSLALAGYEGVLGGNGFLAVVFGLLGLPAGAIGTLLGTLESAASGSISVPSRKAANPSSSPASVSSSFAGSSSKSAASPKAEQIKITAAPRVASMKGDGGKLNGKRKLIKVR